MGSCAAARNRGRSSSTTERRSVVPVVETQTVTTDVCAGIDDGAGIPLGGGNARTDSVQHRGDTMVDGTDVPVVHPTIYSHAMLSIATDHRGLPPPPEDRPPTTPVNIGTTSNPSGKQQ